MSKLHKKTGSACLICDESLTKEYCIIFHKTRRQTHSLCLDCGIGYLKPIIVQATNNIRKNIYNGSNVIKCPGSIHCEHRNLCKHTTTFCSLVIPKCDISMDVFKLQYVILTPNAYICPEMKCGQVVNVDPYYTDNNLVCHDGCLTSWCRNCLISPYHNHKSCIEVEAENKNTENGKLIWDLKQKGELKFCPQCRAPCIKNNGCNKMLCTFCNVKWCWICKDSDIDYDHYNFGGVGDCKGKLWQGVDINGNAIPDEHNGDLINIPRHQPPIIEIPMRMFMN
jgi:hypothetical protein